MYRGKLVSIHVSIQCVAVNLTYNGRPVRNYNILKMKFYPLYQRRERLKH